MKEFQLFNHLLAIYLLDFMLLIYLNFKFTPLSNSFYCLEESLFYLKFLGFHQTLAKFEIKFDRDFSFTFFKYFYYNSYLFHF